MLTSVVMHLAHAAIAASIATSAPATTGSDDHTVQFVQEGNIVNVVIAQETCDKYQPDFSVTMEAQFVGWHNAIMDGDIFGRIICN